MHRDHKLGLALGVLVVGFAAALCFPKPTDVDQRLLQLENTTELDADIAELPVRAYTDADPAPAPEPPPAPVTEPAEIVPGGDGDFDLLAAAPEPIPTETVSAVTENVGEADHEATASSAADVAQDLAPMPQYQVRPGDTLSSIAAQLLGNHSRYVELYDANREILATPDDLQPGMTLNVPGGIADDDLILPDAVQQPQPASVVEQDQRSPAPVETNGDSIPAEERPRRFSPAKSPLIPAQPVSRSSTTALPPMDATDRTEAATTEAQAPAQTYTVRRGDTLEKIAVKTYGDARAVRDILDANQSVVTDPRRLRPGMTLTLPQR